MRQFENAAVKIFILMLRALPILWLLLTGSTIGFSQDRSKPETIEASAMGTSTQLGKVFQIRLIIYDYSTEEDRQILIEAFNKGRNQGLVNALEKMKSLGRISMTGTLGYDVSYIRSIPTASGRTIRFVTNRPIRFGEAYYDTRTTDYGLTFGELKLDDKDKSLSTGTLYPLAKLSLDKDKQLSIEIYKNPWKLFNIDWGR